MLGGYLLLKRLVGTRIEFFLKFHTSLVLVLSSKANYWLVQGRYIPNIEIFMALV
jgi:hypothetical protein